MKNIEDALWDQKFALEKLEAPLELEERLREALNCKEDLPSRRRFPKGLIAALVTAALLFSYSYDTLAYYGKKMIGYDEVVTGSVSELNEEGAGQEINKSYTFSNGVQVILDGIMFDENELVAFYRVKSTQIKNEDLTLLMNIGGLGFQRYPASGGTGIMIDEYTQAWVHSFEAPAFYEKWLSFDIDMVVNNRSESGKVPFTLDRSKAMKRAVKQEINKEVEIEGLKVTFETLTASRLNTTIEGTIEPLESHNQETFLDGSLDHFGLPPGLRFDIFVDGRYHSTSSAGIQINNKAHFIAEAQGLPAEFQSVEIKNIRLSRMEIVDKTADLTLDTKELVLADDLIIKEVFQEQKTIYVRTVSRGIPIMGLFINGSQVEEVSGISSELPESDQPIERLYKYHITGISGNGGIAQLMVKYINYSRYADETIGII